MLRVAAWSALLTYATAVQILPDNNCKQAEILGARPVQRLAAAVHFFSPQQVSRVLLTSENSVTNRIIRKASSTSKAAIGID